MLLFLWVPEKILSLYDCGLSQGGALALGRKGLLPLSHDCLSFHLFVHFSTHLLNSQYIPTPASSQVLHQGVKHFGMNEIDKVIVSSSFSVLPRESGR